MHVSHKVIHAVWRVIVLEIHRQHIPGSGMDHSWMDSLARSLHPPLGKVYCCLVRVRLREARNRLVKLQDSVDHSQEEVVCSFRQPSLLLLELPGAWDLVRIHHDLWEDILLVRRARAAYLWSLEFLAKT